MTADRRSNRRLIVNWRVRVDGPRGAHHHTIRDFSLEGLFVEAGRPYPPGTRLTCRIFVDRQPVEVTAEVRHQSNTYQTEDGGGPYKGMGLRFVRVGADELAILREHLTRLTERKPES